MSPEWKDAIFKSFSKSSENDLCHLLHSKIRKQNDNDKTSKVGGNKKHILQTQVWKPYRGNEVNVSGISLDD